MRNLLITSMFVAVVCISCNNSSNTNTTSAKPLVVATADAKEKYQCPMNCQGDTAYTTAGQCPVCEMDLEKK
nr:hypothetical protein [Bacteroidota bacterium]